MYELYRTEDMIIRLPEAKDYIDFDSKVEILRCTDSVIAHKYIWEKETYKNLYQASLSFDDPDTFREAVRLLNSCDRVFEALTSDDKRVAEDAMEAQIRISFRGETLSLPYAPRSAQLIETIVAESIGMASGNYDA